MKQIVTRGIVLTRIDFQEADRILTMLTPDHGKVRLIAKGVRKVKSKLAGGIELFSVSQITFIPGRGEIKTLVSSRLQTHFGNIVKDINRTMLGYDFLKIINKVTEDGAEPAYFELLESALEELNDQAVPSNTLEFWFIMQLLNITGHAPNLINSDSQTKLSEDQNYNFSYETMSFKPSPEGSFTANHIKLMRLGAGLSKPTIFAKVQGSASLMPEVLALAKSTLRQQVSI